MQTNTATLHMICGKIAAGKSTLAAKLADQHDAVLIAEDAWLSALYGDRMESGQDFVRYSARLRSVLGPHITDLLRCGQSVVLDFQANTVESRDWMRGVFEAAEADHCLHVLSPPDEVCLARLHARNDAGSHPFKVSDAMFHAISKHFAEPQPDEGFTILRHE